MYTVILKKFYQKWKKETKDFEIYPNLLYTLERHMFFIIPEESSYCTKLFNTQNTVIT